MKELNIAIIGAGYAGATAALALSQLGATVTVYEQAQEINEVGAGIGLRPSTMDQFRKLGIFDRIAAVTSPSDYFEILTAHSQRIAMEEWPEKQAFGASTHFVHRGDFIETLLSTLPAGMVKLNHRLSRIVDNGDGATAVFENGVTVNADLIVGADGIRSQVRKYLFGDKPPCLPASTPIARSSRRQTPLVSWLMAIFACTWGMGPRFTCCHYTIATRCRSMSLALRPTPRQRQPSARSN